MRGDALWEPWLAQIHGLGAKSLLAQLKQAKTLEFGKSCTDAYLAATASKCADCGAWTGHVNLLALRPACGSCFTTWSRANLMVKSKVRACVCLLTRCSTEPFLILPSPHHLQAQLQYLLSTAELAAIPCVTYIEPYTTGPFSSITLVMRAHAERLARERYPNGLAGLEADREARKQKVREGRAQVLANYEKRKAEAIKVGRWVDARAPLPVCTRPQPPIHTHTQAGRQEKAQVPQGVGRPAEQHQRAGPMDGR